VLPGIYTDGYLLGARSAAVLLGQRDDLGLENWSPGDSPASRALLDVTPAGLQALLTTVPRTAAGINTTRMRRLADVLTASTGMSEDDLTTALDAVLQDESSAQMVAITEVTRASAWAAMDRYSATSGVTHYSWITTPDECAECRENEAAGALLIGQSFPNGLSPLHPRCRCGLRPVVQVG
jgi:hypothetical protein